MTAADFNAKVIDEFRANGGRVGGVFEGNAAAAAAPHRREVGCQPESTRSAIWPTHGGTWSSPRTEERRAIPTGTTTSRRTRTQKSRSEARRSTSSPRRRRARSASACSHEGRALPGPREVRTKDRSRRPGDRPHAPRERLSDHGHRGRTEPSRRGASRRSEGVRPPRFTPSPRARALLPADARMPPPRPRSDVRDIAAWLARPGSRAAVSVRADLALQARHRRLPRRSQLRPMSLSARSR